ncbi:hypothetical protein P7C73_g2824, partial [Tremellales sp. Uapishka_1]
MSAIPQQDLPPPRPHPADREREPPVSVSVAAVTIPEWTRPSIKQIVHAHPKTVSYAVFLVLLFCGEIAGWAVFVVKKRKLNTPSAQNETPGDAEVMPNTVLLVVDAIFLIAILVTLILIARQAFIVHHLFSRPLNEAERSRSTLPPWLLPRLPTYVDAVGGRNQATGDVEDRYIVGENLPVYGENRGSKLLLRSESRGGRVSESEIRRQMQEEVPMGDLGRPTSYSTIPPGLEEQKD